MIKQALVKLPFAYQLRILQLKLKRGTRNLFVKFAEQKLSEPIRFDPFPDEKRVLPFGSGASIYYNYVDLRFVNPTQHKLQFKIWVTEQHLKGILYNDQDWPFSYHVEERKHQFHQKSGKNYRQNEIWRRVIDKRTGNTMEEQLMIHNYSEVKYEIDDIKMRLENV
ncbi:hypothetical protein EHS13_11520 [Paenibacillus psychroresistens]|uniref:Uncharacterized protein n=1 Tax=Paenibacillus psychroresistens TaxID=1778678 RepID=A0A6B8RJ99_9BACL|nr:VanW family protein [Paenibacillus psychroresistens]QGQ95466.1 hypothetical protein EHS13_11520 [Paenibacillus psychroresistens]